MTTEMKTALHAIAKALLRERLDSWGSRDEDYRTHCMERANVLSGTPFLAEPTDAEIGICKTLGLEPYTADDFHFPCQGKNRSYETAYDMVGMAE